jgi:large repetitive protein
MTRRRLFSTDAWDLNSFAYANDNPPQYAGAAYSRTVSNSLGVTYIDSSDHDFTFNSRFVPGASPSLEVMNQVALDKNNNHLYANFIATEFLPNPSLPPPSSFGNSVGAYIPNSSYTGSAIGLPLAINTGNVNNNLYANAFTNAQVNTTTNVILPVGGSNNGNPLSSVQVQTPSLAHRDRKINLNFPLPVSNDPAEPVRQKWCRETYQMLKAILPPASVDTPEELAALSQFVVNIIDFRDADCAMTRFVNTDLEVTDVLTKSASPIQTATLDPTWSVSPPGVRFSTTPIPSAAVPAPHFPYDPALYSPDGADTPPGSNVSFLVQHGMEFNPIALNEVLAYQAQYSTMPDRTTAQLKSYQGFFVEMVNTLTEAQNNSGAGNASAISLQGWDLIIAPDVFGWGRPDPISGDVPDITWPPWVPNPAGDATMPPLTTPAASSQRPNATTTDPNLLNLQAMVQQFSFTPATAPNSTIKGINDSLAAPAGPVDYFIVGDYRDTSTITPTNPSGTSLIGTFVNAATGWAAPFSNSFEINPVVTTNSAQLPTTTPPSYSLNVKLPDSTGANPFTLPSPVVPGVTPATSAQYYWVYLRRPANPFDTAPPNQVRPNKEMVVVDAMRFPVINSVGPVGGATVNLGPPPTVTVTNTNEIYSAQRHQPYRGGHLLRTDTSPPSGLPTAGNANGVTTISPPSPAYAYGYSEQLAPPTTGGTLATSGSYARSSGTPNTVPTTKTFKETINVRNVAGENWTHLPFLDRDFASVAELLQVPGCPPGLFTKQFVEEPYPGNILDAAGNLATGTDNRDFISTPAAVIVAPADPATVPTANPSRVGRKDFHAAPAPLPSNPTFPYLPDNFYYTAASVAPPAAPNTGQTHLTTEIGGWTGAGWHKMLEFFEVPSSANGAIGTTDNGNNYDWLRADLKPGQINLNLIIDEEVFAGVIDDPRLNETLATYTSIIPYVVNQIDNFGYPAHDNNGNIIGRSPIFNTPSVNIVLNQATGLPNPNTANFGRGYTARDPNIGDYDQTAPTYPGYQQIHGLKAAFSDFLKLRHGGSGYLFGYGAGPTGSGDFIPGPLALPLTTPTFPLAAERPFRSLSYPDINYTVLRPASLPPSPKDRANPNRYAASTPPLPSTAAFNPDLGDLGGMFQYAVDQTANPVFPFLTLNPVLAPMHESLQGASDFPYVQDSGIKNPFLAIQYGNQTSPLNNPANSRPLGPPYDTNRALAGPPTVLPQAAPFPPPIPPTPARRLFQMPDFTTSATTGPSSNASILGQYDIATHAAVNTAIQANLQNPTLTAAQLATEYPVNKPTITLQLSVLPVASAANQALSDVIGAAALPLLGLPTPPSLFDQSRAAFQPDNFFPNTNSNPNVPYTNNYVINNYLGAGPTTYATPPPPPVPTDQRQHPLFRTELLQKITNLTTVRTHQFAVWITVGFFEVVRPGTAELGITDILGQEIGLSAGKNVRYRSFFVIDRTKATGFNPYFPGNFRDCVSYRRRIE